MNRTTIALSTALALTMWTSTSTRLAHAQDRTARQDAAPPAEDKSGKDGAGESPSALKAITEGSAKTEAAAETDASSASGHPRRRAAPPETFQEALENYYADDFVGASAKMYDYLTTNEQTVENYEWAEYFLGMSLLRLDFRQAASEYLFNVAKDRTKPEILPEALQALEEIMQGPYDESLLDGQLLTDSEFGYLPPYVADFVAYHQGLADLRDGHVAWAERIFRRISDESPYHPQALYAIGVQRLRRNSMTDAVKHFRQVLEDPQAKRDLRNLARLALARVLYENERYRSALKIYDTVEVPELSTAEASLFLEKAWTSYWLRDYRKTMGILYALEAPSYREYFAPEKYMLRALVYKNLCHYIPAKREIRRFRFRFGETLDNIRDRIDLRQDDRLRIAALSRGKLERIRDFGRKLADEADRIATIGGEWTEVGLDDKLREIYRLKTERTDLTLSAELRKETRRIAEELVEFEEQMYLLDYEIGLEIYRRLKKEDARRPTKEDDLDIPATGDTSYYEFADEFWNDELPDYDFFVENRCFDEGAMD
ncbi:MAG: hypothetical protein IPK13_00965 [Deltaproteobacteria bacterium]|nr:hypothetical protein [Deltaproteobacteria bacterium]